VPLPRIFFALGMRKRLFLARLEKEKSIFFIAIVSPYSL
jgi:hypothetical protein